MLYDKIISKSPTQRQPVLGKRQVRNSAGGYVFALSPQAILERFLILGSDQPTYYASAQENTYKNVDNILELIRQDGPSVINTIVEVSEAGRAPRNDHALFALALVMAYGDTFTRRAVQEYNILPRVARTGGDLLKFVRYVNSLRGWGRGLREVVSGWYTNKDADSLAYQTLKYRQRDGWTHRDVLRLAHPEPPTYAHDCLFAWITQGETYSGTPEQVLGFETASRSAPDPRLIRDYSLTREMVPNTWLNSVEVWEALLETMPLHATIRNLGKMTNVGLFQSADAVRTVLGRLRDQDYILRSRLHPVAVLLALKTYSLGHGLRGSLSWNPVQPIVGALDDAFYAAFGSVQPTGKRILLAMDVSGSMFGSYISDGALSAAEATAALALVTARTEDYYHIMQFSRSFKQLGIHDRMALPDALRLTRGATFGATDCALPMLWAERNRHEFDAFVILTDNETWYGHTHPFQALQGYREHMGIPAKLVVVGMTATNFTIADPEDAGSLDVVGFDTAAPNLMSNFIRE